MAQGFVEHFTLGIDQHYMCELEGSRPVVGPKPTVPETDHAWNHDVALQACLDSMAASRGTQAREGVARSPKVQGLQAEAITKAERCLQDTTAWCGSWRRGRAGCRGSGARASRSRR